MSILTNQSEFKVLIENELITNVILKSEHPNDPIVVRNIPVGWKCIGSGNYAAVFIHQSEPNVVVKVYGKEIDGLEKEVQVYKQLGEHPAYSKLIQFGEKYLVLKRLEGVTLYNALANGERIPESVIKDINNALKYAISRDLNPYDVHGKNVMMKDGELFSWFVLCEFLGIGKCISYLCISREMSHLVEIS